MASRTSITMTRHGWPVMTYTEFHKLVVRVPFRWGIQLLSRVVRIMAIITAIFLVLLSLTEALGSPG